MSQGVSFARNLSGKYVSIFKLSDEQGDKFARSVKGYYAGHETLNTKQGPSVVHGFKTDKGLIGIWAKKDLNDNLIDNPNVQVGDLVLVEFVRKIEIPGGKTKYVHNFIKFPGEAIDPASVVEASEEFDVTDEEIEEIQELAEAAPAPRAVRPAQPATTKTAAQMSSVSTRLNQFKR